MKKFYITLMVVLMAGIVWGQQKPPDVIGSRIIQMVTDNSVDTAAVLKFTPAFAPDSFVFLETLIVSPPDSPTDSSVVKWVSGYQKQRLTPSAVWDEARVIACSVVYQAVTLGFELDPGATYTTAAKICDSLTYLFNNTTTLKDSITAQDSVTYVKLIDKYSTVTHDGRWTLKLTLTGGATSTLDTLTNAQRTTAGYITTVAMVCDSMVAKVNAAAGATKVTAYDSTTFWIVQSDQKGLDFSFDITDTTTDTTRTVANKADSSAIDSTYYLGSIAGASSMDACIIINGPMTTDAGAGNLDTGVIVLYSYSNNQTTTHVTKYCAAMPCTCLYAITGALADSTLLPGLKVDIEIQDSMSYPDAVALPYRLEWEILLK